MYNEHTNLIPIERQHLLSKVYFLRLGVVGIVLTCVLVVIAGVFLLPTFVYLTATEAAKEARLAGLEAALTSDEEKSLSDRLAVLTNDADVLSALKNLSSASATISTFLSVSRPGIILSGIGYTPVSPEPAFSSNAVENKEWILTLTGIAATRDALRNYQLALSDVPSSRGADLPVSAYAKDSNISFTITVTLASVGVDSAP